MQPFDFEKVYEELAKPLDNRPVPTNPFGPMLVKILLEDDGIFVTGILAPSVMTPYFSSDEGAEHLAQLIDQMLSKQADTFCIAKAYECHVNGPGSDQKGIAVYIHHKTGTRVGCLLIDAERISHYAPLLDENVVLVPIRIDVKPLH